MSESNTDPTPAVRERAEKLARERWQTWIDLDRQSDTWDKQAETLRADHVFAMLPVATELLRLEAQVRELDPKFTNALIEHACLERDNANAERDTLRAEVAALREQCGKQQGLLELHATENAALREQVKEKR